MFVMRPSSAGDQEAIAAMIRARSGWMRERGIHGWQGWESSAEVLAAQAGDPSFPVWVMTGAGGGIAGCTSLYEQSPPWFWTVDEQAEPCFFLATTVTDPALSGQRLGALMAWSVLDLAARTGRQWVRRSTTEAGLVRYYRDVQGWDVVREKEHKGFLVTGMARRAEPQEGLPVRVAVAVVPGLSGR
jgi:predicted N-acetyltransferase YhbS